MPMPRSIVAAYAGVASALALVVVAAVLRPESAFSEPEPRSRPRARESTSPRAGVATERAPDAPTATTAVALPPPVMVSAALPSMEQRQAREAFLTALRQSRIEEAVEQLDRLASADPTAPVEPSVRPHVIALAQRVVLVKGTAPDRFFATVANKLGTQGPDILYELVVSKGGTTAASWSERLLGLPEVRARGTAALRLAWDLRTQPCDQRASLAPTAAEVGDLRAYVQLQQLLACPTTACCLKGDAAVDAAAKALAKKLGLQR